MKKAFLALLLALSFAPAYAQRPALIPPVVRFSDQNGKPLAFGTLQSFAAGTTTPLPTYVDSTTGALNTNPVVLDATGSATVFLGANVYKLVLKNAAGAVQWTSDNIAQGMFASTYVTSFTGNQGTKRTGDVAAIDGDYTCAMVTGAVCTLPPSQTLYYQTIQAGGASAPQEPILNFIAGVSGSVTNPVVTSGGSGYTGSPAVTFTGGTCSVLPTGSSNVSSGSVTNPVITAGGSGYTSAPTVIFTGGGGAGAAATAVLTSGVVTSLTITSAGTGYTSAPSVSFTGGGGTGAAATVTFIASGAVSSLIINTSGAGCVTAPTVSFSGGGGTGAAATVSLSPNGISCVDNPGSTSTDCTFTIGGTGGVGSCVLNDVSGSRSTGATYQNATNSIMYLSGSVGTNGGGAGLIIVAEGSTSASDQVYRNSATQTVAGGDAGFFAAILPGYFYDVQRSGSVNQTVNDWIEITGCGSGGGGGGSGTIGGAVSGTGLVPVSNGTDTLQDSTLTVGDDGAGGTQIGLTGGETNLEFTPNVTFQNSITAATSATFQAGLSSNGQKITSVADPTNAQDAATKNYVDSHSGGNAITALTGDVTATGPGSVGATLATVLSSPGSCGDATHVCQTVFNGKGLATTTTSVAIAAAAPPTGTGFVHITSGSQDSAARAVNLATADVTGVTPLANTFGSGVTTIGGEACTLGGSCPAPTDSVPHAGTPDIFLNMQPNTVNTTTGVITDVSGNGNNATFTPGAVVVGPSYITLANGGVGINLPSALNGLRSWVGVVDIDPYSFVGGANTFFAPSVANTACYFLETYNAATPFNFGGAPGISCFQASAGNTITSSSAVQSSGLHTFGVTLGTNAVTDPDHYYFDGVEVSYTNQGAAAGLMTSGNWVIGSGLYGPAFPGKIVEFLGWNAELSASDMATEAQADQADTYLRGLGQFGPNWPTTQPIYTANGNSITAGLGTTDPWPNNLTLDSSLPVFFVNNIGNAGKAAVQINYSTVGVAAGACSASTGPNIASIADATNDFSAGFVGVSHFTGLSVAQIVIDQAQIFKKAGCVPFVATMIARLDGNGATDGTNNGQTWDANKNATDSAILQLAPGSGAAAIIGFSQISELSRDHAPGSRATASSVTSNVATITGINTFFTGEMVHFTGCTNVTALNGQTIAISATGLSGTQFEVPITTSNVTSAAETCNVASPWFQDDLIHPNNAGQTLLANAASNAINAYFGYSRTRPNTISSTSYAMGAVDTYTVYTGASAGTFTLPSCIGQLGAVYTIYNTTSYPITLLTNSSTQPINGVDYSSSGLVLPNKGEFALKDMGGALSTGGCSWSTVPINPIITTPQIISSGSAPTIANGAGAGTSPGTPTIAGTNMDGVITVTTGTATATSSTLATITFNGTLGTAPQGCTLMPRNSPAAAGALGFFTTAPSTTSWTIATSTTVPPAISTTLSWSYKCE